MADEPQKTDETVDGVNITHTTYVQDADGDRQRAADFAWTKLHVQRKEGKDGRGELGV